MPDIEKLIWTLGGTILMALVALGFGLFAYYHSLSQKIAKERIEAFMIERQSVEARLEEAIRLVHIGALAGGTSHYLSQILFAITGLIELIAKNDSNMINIRKLASLANEEAQRGLKITDQLQQVARPMQIRLDILHITQVLDLVMAEGRLFGADVSEIECGLTQHTGKILGDARLLKRLFELLLTNAVDATKKDGTISIHYNLDKNLDGHQILLIKIADTGTGMDKETVQRATDPFFTSKSRRDRLGLGLSFALGLAKIHLGDIGIESTINQGTTVKLTLPLATLEELEKNAEKDLDIDNIIDPSAMSMEDHLIAIKQGIALA